MCWIFHLVFREAYKHFMLQSQFFPVENKCVLVVTISENIFGNPNLS